MSAAIDIYGTPSQNGASRAPAFDELMRDWDGEQAAVRYDRMSGASMFVCIHSTQLGPSAGGTRMRVYGSPIDGLADAMRLSAAMTRKLAVAGLPFGGGKAVLAVPAIPVGTERVRLLGRYAGLVESLGGRFWTGPDMNTTERDMNLLPYALGRSIDHGGSGTSTHATARGVLHGIRASARHAFGSDELEGLLLLVQGVGGVGGELAELLVGSGARVLVSDVDQARVRETISRLGVRAIEADRAVDAHCDVFAPCANGGILNESSIRRLRCRVVAGAANNQLATPSDAARLRESGILYAPDYVINAGGALHGVGLELLGWTRDEVDRRLAGIGDKLTKLFRVADKEGITTDEAAERLAQERLAAGRADGGREQGWPPFLHRGRAAVRSSEARGRHH